MTQELETGRGGWRAMRRRPWLAGLAGLLLAVVGLVCWGYREFQPPPAGGIVSFTVRPGETVSELATDLQRRELIRSALMFRIYVSYRNIGQAIQAGNYQVRRGTGIPELVSVLASGRVADTSLHVTIPEGFTVVQIADRLAGLGVCNKQDFLHEVELGRFTEPFLAQVHSGSNVKYRLEGYLFPDTYQFDRGESAHKVVDAMLHDFQAHLDTVQRDVAQGHWDLPTLVTEASLVEKEAKVAAERPVIASVIQNRLRNHMRLDIDATIEYILGHRDVLTFKDLKVDDPYNTYLHDGLPPGPIASPGMASILAVLHPAHTQYLYYVVKNDGSGEHYFAVTYAEQLHNEALSQENLRQHSHG